MRPDELLHEGVAILDEIMRPHGFAFAVGNTGRGSGGDFASGNYVRGDRRLELHVRHTVGLVRYHAGQISFGHESFMAAVIGRRHLSAYPGFSDEPVDGFRHLAADLQNHAITFLAGTDVDLRAIAEHSILWESRAGFNALG